LLESLSFSEEEETMTGRDSEAGGIFPDPVSEFAERQKSHKEVDAGTA